jgi:hypothetical protein
MPEGGGEVVRELPRDDVVLTVCLAGAKRLCIGGSTARPSGGRALSSPALRETMFGCGRTKLDGLGATRGARKGGAEAAGARHMAGEGGGGGTEKK